MSARPVLAPSHSGVYQSPPDTSDLRVRASQMGASWVDIDFGSVHDKAGVLRALATALAFPLHFGQNWDALSDSLQDLAWLPAAGHVLHLRDVGIARRALGDEWSTLVEIFCESARYWKSSGKLFLVLVDGNRDLPPCP